MSVATRGGSSATTGNSFVERIDRVLWRHGLGALAPGDPIRLTGGASYETWSLDVVGRDGLLPMILRRMPQDVPPASEQVGPEAEAMLFQSARAYGVPEPVIHHVLTDADDLGRGFFAERIAGETLARRVLRDDRFATVRPHLAYECGVILARIHKVDTATLPPLETLFAREMIERLHTEYLRLGVARPVFALAFRWLRQHCPAARHPARLVHGDFRNGNLIFGSEGIRAVLDWELAHLGDPAEDLGWISVNSWRFGNRNLDVGGFGTVDQLLRGYSDAGGVPIAKCDILFWRVMGSLSWGLKCHAMALPVQDGSPIVVERAMIGRRVSETELDLLDLLGPEMPS